MKSKLQKNKEAEERNQIRSKKSHKDQLLVLDSIFGKGRGAAKERARLEMLMSAPKPEAKKKKKSKQEEVESN